MKFLNSINLNCLFVVIVVAYILAFTIPAHMKINDAEKELQKIEDNIDEYRDENGEIDDVGGVGLVANQLVGLFGWLGVAIVKFLVWAFDIYAAVLLLFSAIARLVYSPDRKRLIAYRILMGLVSFLLILLEILCIFLAIGSASVVGIVVAVVLLLFIICIFRNTYTERVYQ